MVINPFETLKTWSQSPLGEAFLHQETRALSHTLAPLRGRFLVWASSIPNPDLTSYLASVCPSLQPIIITHTSSIKPPPEGMVVWSSGTNSLPLAEESVDCVVLQHCLEFSDSPDNVLQEVQRVLVPGGHLILCGFNPWSLWGLWRLFKFLGGSPPWQGHFFSAHKLKEWLKLLSFNEFHIKSYFYQPPFQHPALLQKCHFLVKLEQYHWLTLGGGLMIVAKKRVSKPIPFYTRVEIAQKILSLRT